MGRVYWAHFTKASLSFRADSHPLPSPWKRIPLICSFLLVSFFSYCHSSLKVNSFNTFFFKVNSAYPKMPRQELISPKAFFCRVGQHCLTHYACCCHCVQRAWELLGKCWVLDSRVRWAVVTARCNLVWICLKASHRLLHLKVGLCSQRDSNLPCGAYCSNPIRANCFFFLILFNSFPFTKTKVMCICA